MFEVMVVALGGLFVYTIYRLAGLHSQLQQIKVQLLHIHQAIYGASVQPNVKQSETTTDGIVTSEPDFVELGEEQDTDSKRNPRYYQRGVGK